MVCVIRRGTMLSSEREEEEAVSALAKGVWGPDYHSTPRQEAGLLLIKPSAWQWRNSVLEDLFFYHKYNRILRIIVLEEIVFV